MQRSHTWEKSREKLHHYKRREPERSVLYQLIYSGRDELPRVWDERFRDTYGELRDEVTLVFDEYLNCGVLCHGAARVYCETCKHNLLVAFSCKKRGVCPSCGAKRAVKFAEHMYEEVLAEVAHRHIVFTIPKRLRAYFRYDRRLNTILFQSAWGCITLLGTKDATPGAILTYQSAGEALNFHPHLHGVLTDGVLSTDETFRRFEEIDLKKLTEEFSTRVLAVLRGKELITDEDVRQILSQEHTGFAVWVGEAFEDSESERFVARYVERGPLSLEKLSVEHDIVSYTTKDGRAHEFDPLEFLALLSSHIPKPYESICRYYGYYSCRARGERSKKKARDTITLSEELPEPKAKPSSSWAACMKRIYEINPLESVSRSIGFPITRPRLGEGRDGCPKCKGTMRIVAFIQDESAILKVMDSFGLPPYTAPPPIPKRREEELIDPIPSELDYLG